MLSRNKQVIILSALGLFAFTIVLSVVNVSYDVKNHKLESDIEQFSEEKSNLRASYLAEISLGKLSSRAGEMKMQQANSKAIYKISRKSARMKRNRLLKEQAENVIATQPRTSISGY